MELHPIGAAGLDALALTKRLAQWLEKFLGPPKNLDESARREMEFFFGRSLGDVRLYDSSQAGEIAQRLGADAFSFGTRVFAPAAKVNPQTREGLGLLAHELTHVIQQTQPQPLPYKTRAPESNAGHSAQWPAQGKEQIAGYSPPYLNSVQRDMEGQARATERAVLAKQNNLTNGDKPPPEINVAALADRVYRLIHRELVLERERVVQVK